MLTNDAATGEPEPSEPLWPFPGNPDEHVGTRHHLVPRFYLERFAANGRVAVVDPRTHKRRVTSIRDTATERDFYTFIDVEGSLDGHLELWLGRVEDEAAAAIRNLTSVFRPVPSPGEHEAMCRFIATQRMRGRSARRDIEMFADLTTRLLLDGITDEAAARAYIERRGATPTASLVRSVLDTSAALDDIEFVPDPNAHLSMIASTAEKAMPHLIDRPWVVVHFDEISLITSDEPVTLYSETRDQNRGVGVGNAEEIHFPLDPRHLLILGPTGQGFPPITHMHGVAENAVLTNGLSAFFAYEHLFMHPDHRPTLELVADRPLFNIEPGPLPSLNRYTRPPERRRTERRRPSDGHTH